MGWVGPKKKKKKMQVMGWLVFLFGPKNSNLDLVKTGRFRSSQQIST